MRNALLLICVLQLNVKLNPSQEVGGIAGARLASGKADFVVDIQEFKPLADRCQTA
jgi:hypothetical protein